MATTVRLPLRLEQALAEYCADTKRSKSEVIIEALERRFSTDEPAKAAYETALEAGFIGAFSTNRAGEAKGADTKTRVKAAIRKKHGRGE